ncbi:MAG: hypothetical protein K6C97_04575 [Treponema sp.]|nr:hypothetical protein [Treponema sp.]
MKKLIFFVTICIFSFALSAQEASSKQEENLSEQEEVLTDSENQEAKESDDIFFLGNLFKPPKSFSEFTGALDFVMQFEPGVSINTESNLVSAPSPIIYPITIGALWPDYTFFATQPSIAFFMTNHLWYDGKALPAEIENRTSTTLNFLFTIPAVISLYIGNFRLQLMPGLSILARFAFLANNINASDSGYSGSAASDVENINKYFWSNGRFFYFSSGVSMLFKVTDTIKVGPVVNVYLPIVPLVTGEGLQATIISIGVKISL